MEEIQAGEQLTSVDALSLRVESTRAAADAARAEAAKFAATLERLQLEAQEAEEAAERAAQEAAYEAQKHEAVNAKEHAEILLAHAVRITALATTKAQEAAVLGKQATDARSAADVATARAVRLASDLKPIGNYVRTEGGGFVEVVHFNLRDRQVTAADGRLLDHVYEHPSGDWVYRFRSGS